MNNWAYRGTSLIPISVDPFKELKFWLHVEKEHAEIIKHEIKHLNHHHEKHLKHFIKKFEHLLKELDHSSCYLKHVIIAFYKTLKEFKHLVEDILKHHHKNHHHKELLHHFLDEIKYNKKMLKKIAKSLSIF